MTSHSGIMYLSLTIVVLFTSLPLLFVGSVASADNVDLLNTCLNGKYHKAKPGPEDLHLQCEPWSKRSCCTNKTTVAAHYGKPYNFNKNHCDHIRPLSMECEKHFRQDLCFYECSPNVGPWLASVEQKIRKQKYFEVPLCASDCDAWFEACRNDYTCTDNWARNFDWVHLGNSKYKTNVCPEGSSCKTFEEIYRTSNYFCENVWDQSWKYTPDDQHCMRLWFDGSHENPNDAVAKWKVSEMGSVQRYSYDSSKVRSDWSHLESDSDTADLNTKEMRGNHNLTSEASNILSSWISLLVAFGFCFWSRQSQLSV